MNTARAIAILVLAVVVGLVGYQIGVTQNIAAQLPAASGAPVPYYYPYHWGFGFGFGIFGFLFWILAIFLFFGLLRAAFGGGRGWGHRYGYMHGPWSDEARARMEDLHKELHGEKPAAPRGGGTSSSP